jgi:predicted NUDIX family NTP pyrophosphohydrolase
MQEFPEVDRGAWFGIEAARKKILKAQEPLLEQIEVQVRREGLL